MIKNFKIQNPAMVVNKHICELSKNWFSLGMFYYSYFFFQHGNTALHEAAWKGFSQTVQILCKWKANAYIKNRGGFAPLHLCCQNGHNETCRVLLLAGCKPDIKNNVIIIIYLPTYVVHKTTRSRWNNSFHISSLKLPAYIPN